VNPVVGETNDGWLNDIRGKYIKKEHVFEAIKRASGGPVEEGAVGAGTGTTCFGFKGGIGTSSRVLPPSQGGYTVGVLVQTNFGGVLQIAGCPIGLELNKYYLKGKLDYKSGGSCMIVVATDAPLTHRNLKRLAKRAILGLARTGGICSNGSGDYVIAFSTAENLRIKHREKFLLRKISVLPNERMSPLFLGVIEATEEAILNSLFKATSMKGWKGHYIEAIPINKVKAILKKYNFIKGENK
jgi:D-aminopeptidase